MTIYVENAKNSTKKKEKKINEKKKKILELLSGFNKVTRCINKINILKVIKFLYTSNNHETTKIKYSMLFTIVER